MLGVVFKRFEPGTPFATRVHMSNNESGYVPCACRDCFDVAISDDGEPALCNECKDAGCDGDTQHECHRADAYGVDFEGEDPDAIDRWLKFNSHMV